MLKVIAITSLCCLVASAPSETQLDFTQLNQFALKLLDNTFTYQENFDNSNIAVSPLSVWSIFSLLAEGSSGETFNELMRELRLPNDLKATQALHYSVNNILNYNNQHVTLKGQKAMFTDKGLQVHQEFCQAALMYNTDIYTVDSNNTTKLANDINYYICVATDGKITNAVKPELLEDLRMILVDALYFKASWTHPFDPLQTKQENFYNSQGKSVGYVNMMYHKAPHNFGDSFQLGAQILELPYGSKEEFSMLILLPYEGMPLKRLLNNLAMENLNWLMEYQSLEYIPKLECYIPRFKISCSTDLIPPLQYTGIISIFDRERALLPGISDSPLFVSKTIQNVEIEVNEEGTVAAAATVVGLENRIFGQRFEANREFVFLIMDKRTNLILFAGTYSDPSVV